jgi:hypothetical protein
MRISKGILFVALMAFLFAAASCSSGKKTVEKAVFEKIDNVKVGAMSQYAETLSPKKFYDKDLNTFWHSGKPEGNFGWISISFKMPFMATGYKLVRRSDITSQAPVDFVLEGSSSKDFPDSDSKWVKIDEEKDQKWNDTTHTYSIKQPSAFIHYRIRILTTDDKIFASVAEWELIFPEGRR